MDASAWAATADVWQKGRPEDRAGMSAGKAHVWRVGMESMLARGPTALWGLLASDERERAGRFHFERDQLRFAATRAATRLILAAYLATDPGGLTFAQGPHGKPELAGDGGKLRFSTARSGRIGLVAVAQEAEVGVDVELAVDDFPWDEVASRAFTAEELSSIEALPEQERARGFARAWVRKEAWAKATGLGIAHVLDADHEIPDLGPISVHNLDPGGEHLGALAVVGGPVIELWDFAKE